MICFIHTGCDRSFNRSDKLKEHLKKHSGKDTMKKSVVTTINTSAVNQAASNGLIMVQPTLSIDTSTIDISQYKCKHCNCSGFETVQLHKTHEMLCEKIPKMVRYLHSVHSFLLLFSTLFGKNFAILE